MTTNIRLIEQNINPSNGPTQHLARALPSSKAQNQVLQVWGAKSKNGEEWNGIMFSLAVAEGGRLWLHMHLIGPAKSSPSKRERIRPYPSVRLG